VIKIIHLVNTIDAGGAETMLLRLLRHMNRERFQNIVLSLTGTDSLLRDFDVAASSLHTQLVPNQLSTASGIAKIIGVCRRERPEILQTWLYKSDLLGFIAGTLTGIPSICWNIRCSDMGDTYRRGLNGWVVRTLAFMSKRVDAVIVNSDSGHRFHQSLGYAPRRWEVIPNGFELGMFRPNSLARNRIRNEIGIDDMTPLVGLIARFDPAKGHETFFKAASILVEQGVETRFLVAGTGCDPGNEAFTKLIPDTIRQNVILLGHRRDATEVTAALDIACSTSVTEGFSNAIGEAMACGVPCVVTEAGDSSKIVGGTGRVVPIGNANALAMNWHALIEMGRPGLQALGQAARQRIQDNFDIRYIVRRYEDVYDDLSAKVRARA
jgi:glycosyltransferase involved in cell wall biosynthesis